ncbi:MAG: MaoC/PaaZ C-terminal domain-containing protein [Thermodesulfobacteriota bacterium]
MGGKQVFFEDINVGDSMPNLVKEPITETQLVMYAGASGDFNPIHTVHSFGEKAGFGGVIGHGMLSMAMVGQALTDWLGNKALKKFGVNFRAVTKPKDVITVKGTVSNKYTKDGNNCIDIDLISENQRGETVIAGKATAALPSKS